ncbi:MAG: hypothetical protein J7494_01535 [Sphingobium sp.]|nr:hypothetical protein [Sphingobium sp.]
MLKMKLAAAVLGLTLATAPAFAQGPNCTREDLEGMVASYVAAQTNGDPLKLPLADWTQYNENLEVGTLFGGILSKPLNIAFHRSIHDLSICTSFVEVIVTDPVPYVIGMRLQFAGRYNAIAANRVNDLESIVTGQKDWLFNARKTLGFSKAENWGVIPEAERDSRNTLVAAANAYLDLFNDKKVQVPWGTPCARLEGGLYTGKGKPGEATAEDSCAVGVPSGVKLAERRYIVDESLGAVAVILEFGNNHLPDVHAFRIEKGKIRYVHTMTVCKSENCGLQLSDDVKKRLAD